MNAPKVTEIDYIQFLIAAQRVYTCTEAARCAATASHTTLLWTDGLSSLPCDCRLYEPAQEGQVQVTKNDHFLAMLNTAKEREFSPRYVCFDGWYASLANLKAVRGHGWHFLTRLKHNR